MPTDWKSITGKEVEPKGSLPYKASLPLLGILEYQAELNSSLSNWSQPHDLTSQSEAVRRLRKRYKRTPSASSQQMADGETSPHASGVSAFVDLAGVTTKTCQRGASVSYDEKCWSL